MQETRDSHWPVGLVAVTREVKGLTACESRGIGEVRVTSGAGGRVVRSDRYCLCDGTNFCLLYWKSRRKSPNSVDEVAGWG